MRNTVHLESGGGKAWVGDVLTCVKCELSV